MKCEYCGTPVIVLAANCKQCGATLPIDKLMEPPKVTVPAEPKMWVSTGDVFWNSGTTSTYDFRDLRLTAHPLNRPVPTGREDR